MALVECGTHALVDAVFDSVDRFSEHKLARRLLASLTEGTLLLADRNFAGYELWGLARATGAHLDWRIKKNLVFPPVRVLPDGSYLSIMRTPQENLRHGHARAEGRALPGQPDGHLLPAATRCPSSWQAPSQPFCVCAWTPCSPPSLRAGRAQRRPDFLPVPSVPATDLATTADRPTRRALRPSAPGRSPRIRRRGDGHPV